MQEKVLNDKIKKNLLDLQYNKYLQYYNTSIIVLFTYFIGAAIALLTRQIDYTSQKQMLLLGIISIPVITVCVLLMLKFRNHLKNIFLELRKLNID